MLSGPRCLVAAALSLSLWLAAPAEAQPSRSLVPVESLHRYAVRYEAAIASLQTGDCARLARLNADGNLGELPCDQESRHYYRSFRVLGRQQFGTAAIIDRAARDRRTGQAVVATDLLALGPDRRFRLLAGTIYGRGDGIHQVGTRAAPRVRFLAARTANVFLDSLRRRDCDLFFHTGFTGPLSKPAACTEAFSGHGVTARLRRQVAADRSARPVRLGGTRDIQFYRLRTRLGHVWTLIVDRNVPPPGGVGGGSYLAFARDVF